MDWVLVLLVLTALSVRGQADAPGNGTYTVVERGADYRTWEKTTYEFSAAGEMVPQKHRYTELATGMNYKNANGQWVEAQELIEPQATGGAAAVQGQHQVYFPYNLYQGEYPDNNAGRETVAEPAVGVEL